jgi:hypothetical protein
MRHALPRLLSACLFGSLAAQEEIASGPLAGSELPPARVCATVGARAGAEFDAAVAIGDAPGALLFVHEMNRNTAPLLRGLDQLATEYALLGLKTATILIAADRTEAEQRAQRTSGAMKLRFPLVVSVDGAEGPGSYALARKCTLTLVLCKDRRVHRAFGLTDVGRQDLPKLRQWIEEVTGPMPKSDAELKALLQQRLPKDPVALRDVAIELALDLQRARRELVEATVNPPQSRPMREGPVREAERPASRPQAEPKKDC